MTLDVAIIGGGLAGAAVALHLLARLGREITIGVFEKCHEPGRGIAYSTRHEQHLLNVQAGSMSLLSDRPDHFVEWATMRCHRQVSPKEYLPRHLYGDYVDFLLGPGISSREFQWTKEEIVSLTETTAGLELADGRGRRVRAQVAVLAIGGTAAPGPVAFAKASPRFYVEDPWTTRKMLEHAPNHPVLIVGSGLTAIDQILTLREIGYPGCIHVISRHGLVPRDSVECPERETEWGRMHSQKLSAILRRLREEIDEAAQVGISWQSLFDSTRADLQSLWLSLDLDERRRFLRHVRPYWDVHKHRMPQETASRIHTEIRNRSVVFHAGYIVDYAQGKDAAQVFYRPRGEEEIVALTVCRIYNCCGVLGNYKYSKQPLVMSLLHTGLARLDSCELGLETSPGGALQRLDGSVSDRIYAIGSVRRGTAWDATAVPDIRAQAAALAELLEQRAAREYAGR